jgi:hypothetical protein
VDWLGLSRLGASDGAAMMPDGNLPAADPIPADLALLPRWVAWRTEPRRGGGTPTKVPYSPSGGLAASNNPCHWGTRAEAEAAFCRLGPTTHGPGGIGLVLGKLGNGRVLAGVDLDTCRDPNSGAIEPWAAEVVARIASYTEVSPSDTGVKVLFTCISECLPAVRAAMGSEHGRQWKRGRGEHPPAIELYLSNRYFAVTEQHVPQTPVELRLVDPDTLLWLVREAGPAFARGSPQPNEHTADCLEREEGADSDLASRLRRVLDANTALARRWAGDTAGLSDTSRSALAFALGGAFKHAGFSFDEICVLLNRNPHTAEWCTRKGNINGGRELRRIWENAGSSAEELVAGVDRGTQADPDLQVLRLHRRPPPPLPLEVFGPRWGVWLQRAAAAASCSPDYVAAPLLSAASVLIGNSRWSQAGPSWVEPPHLWCGSVGDSGGGKSPGADAVLGHVVPTLERRMAVSFPEQLREHQLAAEAAKARKEAWEKEVRVAQRMGNPPPLPPAGIEPQPEPQPPRLRVDDATVEKVAALVASAAQKGVLMVRDEIAGWLLGMGAYNAGARAFWLESYGGRPYRVDRVKHPEPIDIPYFAVAWWGGVQPDRLAQLMEDADDGLLARFIWFWPDSIPFDLAREAPDLAWATEALERLRLLEMAPPSEQGTPPRPIQVPLAEAALPQLVAFGREMQARQDAAGGLMRSAFGKARGLALRLSLVLEHLWWCGSDDTMLPPPKEISGAAFLAATRLVAAYLMPMAERVYGDAVAPKADRDAATLARWITRGRPAEVHVRHIQREVRLPGLTDAAAIHAAAKVLVEAGWLCPPEPGRAFQGRGRSAYPVNPKLWERLS